MPFEATPQAPLTDRTLRRWLQSYLDLVTQTFQTPNTQPPTPTIDRLTHHRPRVNRRSR